MSRSNLAAKGLVVEADTIDRDYTSEIIVLLHNQGLETWYIPSKRKIAQILFLVVKNIEEFKEVEELPQTNRGDKGFGSTDKEEQKLDPKKAKEEKWYKNLEEGYAPHGRCPYGIGMYSSSMIDECWSCRVELQKRKNKKNLPIEEKHKEPPKIDEIIEDTENLQEQHQEVNSASNNKKSFIFEGDIAGEPVKVLIDSGSTGNFLDKRMTKRAWLITKPSQALQRISMANGNIQYIRDVAEDVTLNIGDYSHTTNFGVLDLRNHDMILGMPWLSEVNPTINWKDY